MNGEFLSADELRYELLIRGNSGSENVQEMRRTLRRHIRNEARGAECAPRTVNVNPYEELRACEEKYRKLTIIPVSLREVEGKKYNSKLLHLKLRIERFNNTLPTHSDMKPKLNDMIHTINTLIDPKLVASGLDSGEEQTILDNRNVNSDSQITGNSALFARTGNRSKIPSQKSNGQVSVDPTRAASLNKIRNSIQSFHQESFNLSASENSDNLIPPFRESLAEPPQGRSSGMPRRDSRIRGKGCPIYKWKISFRGDSEGMSLNDFLQQVQMYGKSERVSDHELFTSIFHLLDGPAKTWYRASCNKYKTWKHLVQGLKEVFLPEDHDFWSMQDINRRFQKESENFNIYLAEMELKFQNFLEPISERDQLKCIIRNLLPFYLEKLPVGQIKSIAQLTRYCKSIENLRYNLSRRHSLNPPSLQQPVHRPTRMPAKKTSYDLSK